MNRILRVVCKGLNSEDSQARFAAACTVHPSSPSAFRRTPPRTRRPARRRHPHPVHAPPRAQNPLPLGAAGGPGRVPRRRRRAGPRAPRPPWLKLHPCRNGRKDCIFT
ncbi:hypothetical protein SETIT_8G214200v2 [Setaria italica]|uniref:Uncharacterized protein n=2 Tax=Setaria TaxID=4554 RepID=A0A368SA54_SETIT|nr:hypothetical protein SETIT_8G214200v2 [Setaria italica]TKW02128.1 hypothetical protein SEVIR_8G225100v2 [Setaria viridis]